MREAATAPTDKPFRNLLSQEHGANERPLQLLDVFSFLPEVHG
jgi:hypothetical protein